jgi:hypothetical protein
MEGRERETYRIIHERPVAAVGGIRDVEHGRVDHAHDGRVVQDERDGDAEHVEEVGVVYGAVEGVDDLFCKVLVEALEGSKVSTL